MDETTTDVVPTEGGGQETPTPETSSPATEQGSSSEESPNEAVLTRLAEVEGMLRRFQSDEDRGLHRVESQVKDLSTQFETYYQRREAGQSHEQALREEVLDEIVAERSRTPGDTQVPPTEEPAVQPQVAGEDYLSPILKMSGLDSNDPEVIALLREERDPIKRITAIGELAEARKQAQTTPPKAGAVLPGVGGQAIESETLESVNKELQAEIDKPATPATRERIRELGKKQKELLPKE